DLTEAEARKIARGEIEKYFAGLAEKPAPGWAKEALDYAREEGILNGDEGGLRPESYVKRDELAQVELNRERRYREIGDVPDWARDAVQELTGLGVILGTEAIQDGKVTLNMSEAQLRGLVFMKRYVDTRLGGKEGGR
ncbi:MAG: S-layer homology domain-containing protein, partial [Oscillospiraceae bacterium]|nr:S-layer homology domain-containing protein [Oscillospiraceae bacterium]